MLEVNGAVGAVEGVGFDVVLPTVIPFGLPRRVFVGNNKFSAVFA